MFSSSSQILLASVTNLQVDSVTFPPSVISPASSNRLLLGGAGVQGMNIQGKFVISTVIGVYLNPDAVPTLTAEWNGKTTEELMESVPFFRRIVTGSFEKLIMVTVKLPLTGKQYSEEVTENCVAIWEPLGIYPNSDMSSFPPCPAGGRMCFNKTTRTFGEYGKDQYSRAEAVERFLEIFKKKKFPDQYSRAEAVERFLEIFKKKKFPPGASICLALSPNGSLTVTFSNDDSFPKTGKTVINNKYLAEAVLESMTGKNGVSPGTRLSVAERLAQLMENQSRIWANPDNTLTSAMEKMKKRTRSKKMQTKTDQRRCNKDEEN